MTVADDNFMKQLLILMEIRLDIPCELSLSAGRQRQFTWHMKPYLDT